MTAKTVLKWSLGALAAVFLAACIVFAGGVYWIYGTVRDTGRHARQEFGGNTIDALMKVVESDKSSFREKNDAVWALGQIADKRALPMLERLYTGNMPDREPLDKVLSQYELRKAIKWCEQGNYVSWMYGRIKRADDGR